MSLPDYYQLLQVSETATGTEIKAAYRRLAKLYHPDKNSGNPVAEEKFKQIKEAYEVLINTPRRRKYDEKRNRGVTNSSTAFQKKSSVKKNYNFSEEEAKRRQYYQQHYKTKSTPRTPPPSGKTKPGITEIRYILISVPIAVALLLLMIRLYEKPKKEKISVIADTIATGKSEINTSESPYTGVFGKNIFDTTSFSVIKLINKSGYDAIVFLQNDSNKIVRHHFIENNYQLYAENIPAGKYHLYYWLGKQFSYKEFLLGNIMGNFKQSIAADTLTKKINIQKNKKDTFTISLPSTGYPKNDLLLKNVFGRKN